MLPFVVGKVAEPHHARLLSQVVVQTGSVSEVTLCAEVSLPLALSFMAPC